MLYKYPRTFHLPWSLGFTSDDKVLKSVSHFIGKEIVITEKMDGENTSLYHSAYHARSLDSNSHPSQDYVRSYHASIKHLIPEEMRICGENLYAKHSIHYRNLSSFFLAFSVWEDDLCLSWDDTLVYLDALGINSVPVLYRGIFDEDLVRNFQNTMDLNIQEGYVVRTASSFRLDDFSRNVAKFVRTNHVTTEQHWKNQKIIPNLLQN